MAENMRISLRELQQLDQDIKQLKAGLEDFGLKLEEVEEPALRLESELGTAQKRLQQISLEERRLELAVDDKRARSKPGLPRRRSSRATRPGSWSTVATCRPTTVVSTTSRRSSGPAISWS